jgi:6-phosphogluconolactonase
MIRFVKISSIEPVVEYLSGTITAHLSSGERVLWLLSGGSCVPIAVEVARALAHVDVSGLTVSLVDERYVPVGHADSNWQQLTSAGFTLPKATLLRVLSDGTRSEVAAAWGRQLEDHLRTAKFRLGLFGMGPDGHTAGILPHSTAVRADGIVTDYVGPDFGRITLTRDGIALLDEAVLYAVGDAKKDQLEQLDSDMLPDDQPAQYLKAVQALTVFTDQQGEQ